MVHLSEKINPSNNRQEEIVTAYNMNDALFYFKNNNDNGGKTTCNYDHHRNSQMLTIFIHPIQRAALEFNYCKMNMANNPNYDKRIENVSLLKFAEYSLSTEEEKKSSNSNSVSTMRFKMSNYLTKTLLQFIPSKKEVMNENSEIESIVQHIKDECMQVGLVENLEETYHGYSKIMIKQQFNKNEKTDLNNCINLKERHVSLCSY